MNILFILVLLVLLIVLRNTQDNMYVRFIVVLQEVLENIDINYVHNNHIESKTFIQLFRS